MIITDSTFAIIVNSIEFDQNILVWYFKENSTMPKDDKLETSPIDDRLETVEKLSVNSLKIIEC